MHCQFFVQFFHIGKFPPVIKVTLVISMASLYLSVMPWSFGREQLVFDSCRFKCSIERTIFTFTDTYTWTLHHYLSVWSEFETEMLPEPPSEILPSFPACVPQNPIRTEFWYIHLSQSTDINASRFVLPHLSDNNTAPLSHQSGLFPRGPSALDTAAPTFAAAFISACHHIIPSF